MLKNLKSQRALKILYILIYIYIYFFISTPALARVPNLIDHTTGDVKYTFASWPILIIAGGAGAAGLATLADDDVKNYFKNSQSSKIFSKVDDVVQVGGEFYIVDPAALILFGAGELAHNEQVSLAGETLFESLLFTQATTAGLKYTFRRTRPNGDKYSFPSGHTSSFFAIAASLTTLYGPVAAVPSFAVASFVGMSRLDKNAHYFSDVVFGAALGTAIGWGVGMFHLHANDNVVVLPIIEGGQGITVSAHF